MARMDNRTRFATEDGSTTGYVVWAQNHLLQRRQFAYDGRYWYYQPTARHKFQRIGNVEDIPANVFPIMADESGYTIEVLQEISL